MVTELVGSSAVVTGVSNGIGRAIAVFDPVEDLLQEIVVEHVAVPVRRADVDHDQRLGADAAAHGDELVGAEVVVLHSGPGRVLARRSPIAARASGMYRPPGALPGALAHFRLLVTTTHTTVAIRLRFKGSPCTTMTGRR